MKTQIRGRAGTSYMVLSTLVLFAVSACATYNNVADLNLTYIGEAIGPDVSLTYFLRDLRGERRLFYSRAWGAGRVISVNSLLPE